MATCIFLNATKLECNSGHAKSLAFVEYVILICISVIVRPGHAGLLPGVIAGLACIVGGRQTDRRR